MEETTLLLAFGGGVLAFFSPCILPMMPVYLASLVGPGFLTSTLTTPSYSVSRQTFTHALAFSAGFSLVFTAIGFIAGITGTLINPEHPAVRYLSGTVLLAFGIFILAGMRWPRFSIEKRINIPVFSTGILRSFTTGAVFTLAWTPCVTPILGGILTLAVLGQNIANSTGMLFVFSLGMAIPLISVALIAGSILPRIKNRHRFFLGAYIFGGTALILTGFLILIGAIDVLSFS